MKEIPIQEHVGVYGIAMRDNKILMIKKSRGPYAGTYDLPGGRIENGETTENCLRREFSEEVGCKVSEILLFDKVEDRFEYDHPRLGNTLFHHLGTYYKIELQNDYKIKDSPEGHDSLGAEWIDIKNIQNGKIKIPNIIKKVLINLV
jgi:mutator protein MutT